MSARWVIRRLFNAQATAINWADEAGALGYEGPFLETGMDEGFLHFRWMLHPVVGLPRHPFILHHMRHPGGNPGAQELADHPGWEAIEMAGLPVDESWDDIEHHMSRQGPVDNPVPPMSGTLSPFEAAERRLRLGAPRIGWTTLTHNGIALDDWQSPDLVGLLEETRRSPLMEGVKAMLREQPNALDHAGYAIPAGAGNADELHPRLLLDGAVALGGQGRPARGEWRPLGLLLLAAGTDPLAALALGFGTALNAEPDDLFMVTVQHQVTVGDTAFDFELADVISVNRQLRAPDPPEDLQARLIGGSRPQLVDGPQLQSVGVSWERRENPRHTPQVDDPFPGSYAIGRFGPHPLHAEILLSRRSENLDGWLPFVASKPAEARPVLFADHLVRLSTLGGQPIADPRSRELTYTVAAQDIFGRWSRWSTVPFQQGDEPPQAPAILAVSAAAGGQVTVDFAWDWSGRSPEFVELVGAYADAPGNALFAVRVQFGGEVQPAAGAAVIPLDPERKPLEPAGWGAAQDRSPAEPELRFYRLSTAVAVDFAGRHERILQVQARGQSHLHQLWGATSHDPGWNTSPFGAPVSTRLVDPAPPPPPAVPETPQWASLRDPSGVSRMVLKWGGNAQVTGYALYEATETALLAALGRPGPDTAQPFTERLAVLRAANLPALRHVFRRVQEALIPPVVPETSCEVALPRGSAVMHFYAVTAVSQNQVESAWPDTSKKFIAVAAPRLATPAAPALQVEPAAGGARLRIDLRPGAAASQVELYRTTSAELARDVDTMGPPLKTLPVAGPEVEFSDESPPPGWRRVWYRAVAWSAADAQRGLVEARSPASPPVSVLLAPATLPEVSDLQSNEPGSTSAEVLVSWASRAPVAPTPFGPYTAVLESRDANGLLFSRLEGRLDALPAADSLAALPPPDPANRRLVRVGPADNYRLYAWVPRPSPIDFFTVTAKLIDPLGRIGALSAPVLVMAVEMVAVPDVIGMGLVAARQALVDARLVPAEAAVLLLHPETAVVDGVQPPPGTGVEVGSQVLLTTVDGVIVPDVRGVLLATARQVVEALGLVWEEVPIALFDFTTAVVDTLEPAAGTAVRPGSSVLVTPRDAV